MERRFRLHQASDFARLRREGHEYRHSLFVICLATNELPYNRYGFIVARRLGKAVVRNKVRRQLREVVRLLHPNLNTGYDVIIIVRPPIVGQPFSNVYCAVSGVFRQAAVMIDKL